VQFGSGEIEAIPAACRLGAVAGRCQVLCGGLVGDHLHDDRAFGHDLTAVEPAPALALRIEPCSSRRRSRAFGADVDLDQVIGQTRFEQAIWGESEQAPGE